MTYPWTIYCHRTEVQLAIEIPAPTMPPPRSKTTKESSKKKQRLELSCSCPNVARLSTNQTKPQASALTAKYKCSRGRAPSATVNSDRFRPIVADTDPQKTRSARTPLCETSTAKLAYRSFSSHSVVISNSRNIMVVAKLA